MADGTKGESVGAQTGAAKQRTGESEYDLQFQPVSEGCEF
jgi:hypothetical protein